MRRKILTGLMLLSMTASLFSNVGYSTVNAAEYEENTTTSSEAATEGVTTNVEESTETTSTENVSSEEASREASTTEVVTIEEEPTDSVDEELYDASEEKIVSKGNIIASGTYSKWSWSLDAKGIMNVQGSISKPDSGWPWEFYKDKIIYATVSGSGVGDISEMFSNCMNLASADFSGFDTSKVTDMGNMFAMNVFPCNNSLTELDLGSFNTQNVTNMYGMFYGCQKLKSLNLSSFDTGKVQFMGYMFAGCTALTNLNLSNFNTQNVVSMIGMFYECSSLKSLNLKSFRTDKVEYMTSMFNNCQSLSSLDLSGFNCSSLVEANTMFENDFALKYIKSPVNIPIAIKFPPEMKWYDEDRFLLTSMHRNKTTSVTYTYYCPNVEEPNNDFKWNLSSDGILNIYGIISKPNSGWPWKTSCGNIKKVIVNGVGTGNLSGMFAGCTNLSVIDISSLSTENVTDMSSMFYGCKSLKTLDLSNFNAENVTSMNNILGECSNLNTIKSPYNIMVEALLPATHTWQNEAGTTVTAMEQNEYQSITYKWKESRYYIIHFDKNTAKTGSMKRVYPKYGRNYRLPACGFQKPGYTFTGWNTRKDGKGTTYKDQSNVKNLTTTNGKVVFLYAQWKKVSLSTAGKPTLGNYAAGRLTVTCKAVKGADGYLIQYSTNKNMKNAKTVSSTTLKKNIYNLKKGTTYYVRVRAYKVDSAGKKVCGKYSAVQYKKITK